MGFRYSRYDHGIKTPVRIRRVITRDEWGYVMEMPTWVLQLLGHIVTLFGLIGFYYWKVRDADKEWFDRIDERFDKLEAKLDARFDKIDERFDKLDARIDAMSQELSARINEVAGKVDMILGHLGLTGKADRQT